MIQLQPTDKVLGVFRRHWLVFAFALAPVVILAGLTIASPILFGIFLPEFTNNISLTVLGVILILEVLWIIGFLIIADYYLDVWIIADTRLIFVELHGLFSRVSSSVTLTHIQDITVEVHGILGTFFKYGEVRIQSAGTEGEFIFKQVPRPYEIKNLILKAREQFFQKSVKSMDIQKPNSI